MDKLHKAGKFVRLGLSNFTAFEVAEVVITCKYNGWIRPTIYQGMYNFITRSIESELVPACRRYGIDIVVYNPIAGGLFSRQIRTKDAIPQEGRFSDVQSKGWKIRGRYFRDSTFAALDLADETLGKFRLTMIEASLRWLMHHSALQVKNGNDGIIVGVSKVEHLRENISYLERGPLPDEVVKALDAAWVVAKAETANYWHLDLHYTYDTQQELFGEGKK
jgi:aflatoxin B1 aldehyde reductase